MTGFFFGLIIMFVRIGAYMATQVHVAYSATFKGVGSIAGGPYYCAQVTGIGNVLGVP